MNTIVDLRSDTVTRPTPAMRQAMAAAEVGDDVFRDDPTVNALQARSAEIFEREDSLFMPSGSMGNLAAIKVHTRQGQEVICEARAHLYNAEMASIAAVAGCVARPVFAPDGILNWDLIAPWVYKKSQTRARTGLVSVENTANLAGGSVYPPDVTSKICEESHQLGLPVHLDGARIFNAAVALGRPVAELARGFDSVAFCFSKGLGAPVGSMLVGSRKFIEEARIVRKMLGGGMRQAGVLAAAARVALEESPKRLHIDHENARFLAEALAEIPGLSVNTAKVVSNIFFIDVSATGFTSYEISQRLAAQGVLANGVTPVSMRMVTHCDVDRAGCERAIGAMRQAVGQAQTVAYA